MVKNQDKCFLNRKYFYLGITVLHHAIDSKNFDTVAVIIRQLNDLKDDGMEINREVGLHKWTPLYRASNKIQFNVFFFLEEKKFNW